MAKMKGKSFAVLGMACVLLTAGCRRAAPQLTAVLSAPPADLAVPAAGLSAEASGNWEAALAEYYEVVDREPGRFDLWVRIADIHSRQGDLPKVIMALEKAAAAGDGGDLYFRLAQAHSQANEAEDAFKAVDIAVTREPRNPEYLKARGQLANWIGRPRIAADSYRRLHALSPADDEALLNLARAEAWSGDLDRAVRHYSRYLAGRPMEKTIWIEYLNAQVWRGNFAAASKILDRYRKMFGEERAFRKALADILARADRPRQALAIARQLLRDDPRDYPALFSSIIALKYDNRPREALERLPQLMALRPDSRENDEIERFVRTPLRPDIRLAPYGYYSDSDDLRSSASSFEAGINLSREFRLRAGLDFGALEAVAGSGYIAVDGRSRVSWQRPWLGGTWLLSPYVTIGATAAWQRISGLDDRPTGSVFAWLRPGDRLRFNASLSRDVLKVSPLALSLGIRRDAARLGMIWEAGWQGVLEAETTLEHYGDGNRRWEVILAPRWKLLRLAALNLDVGLRGWWFGYESGLQNGYWAPERFRSYMALAYGYWKISDNDGLSIVAGLGAVGDEANDRLRFGSTLDIEGTIGIYRDLMLKAHAALYHNVRQASGAFNAVGFNVQVVYRF